MARTLRQQMGIDARAIVHGAELGEAAQWTDGTNTRRLLVRAIDQGEKQQIRRASVFALASELPTAASGDTFTLWRNSQQIGYRVLYADRAETGLRRHVCHEQLT